ncbi:uncharacterized protein ATNIH1004_002829 [Aspergillus tanneri]|uniref:Uncharacterized protein n=1 Tax=Aspergillus tanneri TaxID=1220188 RepID=A0A5M9MTD9_9EURO|nr:uncharacterized protein ATNIH1004_002829 [Aspergillus tanneri]KAA8650148.1 hypothetical protein ATNIH1004_002829 [Aspergillus tanneri]
MAHLAHQLPWQRLATNFDQRRVARHKKLLVPLNKPQQGKEITYFTVAFARVLAEFSATERRKHTRPAKMRTGGIVNGRRPDVITMWLILGKMETLFKIARYALETVKRMCS